MKSTRSLLAVSFVILAAASAEGQAQNGLGGAVGGFAGGGADDCISPWERVAAQSQLDAFLMANPVPEGPGTPPTFPFWPQGGTLLGDLYAGSFVDLDPTPGLLAWTCTANTRDGHGGTDADIKTFGEQAIGVPVFAAQDGVVAARQDGQPDMNTQLLGQQSNYVILAHPGGRQSWYWHLKNGSVTVSVGQNVKAGQQIGLTASSGNSGGPHLHWEIQDSGVVKEPWAGPCRPGPTLFVNQPAMNLNRYVRDFGFMRSPPLMNGSNSYPFTLPRDSHFGTTDADVYFWILVQNPPANETYTVRWKRPDGSVSYQSGPWPLNNPAWTYAWWWFDWYVYEMHFITGTWTLEFELSGTIVATAPFDVLPSYTPGYNRPPNPITASMDPPAPGAGDVIACRVGGSLYLDDPDWDIVRYQYVWKVNGTTVRSVTSAGRADMIPHHMAQVGQTVTCEVTPSDGSLNGVMVTASAVVKALAQDHPTVSVSQGGVITLTLDVGNAYAGAVYGTAGSLTGTAPGIMVAPGVVVPLAYDWWTDSIVNNLNAPPYTGNYGLLDSNGIARTLITVPSGLPPSFAGAQIWHASLVFSSPMIASNAVVLTAVP